MRAHKPTAAVTFVLVALLLCVCARDAAQAIERWPPWQSYGEAEAAARARQERRAIPQQSQIDALNRKVEALRASGKLAEAIPVAQRALRFTERRHGRNSAATAAALATLAHLLVAEKRFADAEPLLKRALAIREKKKPAGLELMGVLDDLAVLYQRQQRVAEAKPLIERAMALRKKRLASNPSKPPPELKSVSQPPAAAPAKKAPAKVVADAKAEAERAKAKKAAAEAEARARALSEAEKKTVESSKSARRAPRRAHRARAFHRKAARPPADMLDRMTSAAEAEEPVAAESLPPESMAAERKEGGSGAGGAAAPERSVRSAEDAAPGVAAAAKNSKAWDVVPVFYGTDRAEEPNPKRVSYSSDRGHRLQLGRALVTVPKTHQVPQVERPWAIRIPYFDVTIYEEAEDPNKHFTMEEIKKLSRDDFVRLVRERLKGSARFKDQAFVFVHGYNTAFDNAVYRTAQIAYDLKFDGAPFVYSWPSGGAVASYTYDRESAEASKPYMRAFLDMAVKQTGAKAVSIIAHSMGNQPLLDVLKDMKSAAPEGVEISQVILAAPDVDADSFAELAKSIKGLAKGVTLYAASNDRALIVSRNFWGHFRAGDVPAGGPLVLPGVDTIDVTAASTDAFAINHSGYAQNNKLLEDIGELIRTGRRPPDQRHLKLKRITTQKGAYWRYGAP